MTGKVNILLLSLIFVPAGGDFQAALNRAVPGDEIVLPSHAEFVGGFVLPQKPDGLAITIRTDGEMARILSPGKNVPALTTEPGSANYIIKNIEFGKATADALVTNLIYLGEGSSHITLDNIYAHGDPESDLRRCIALNGSDLNVINSRVEECHQKGADSQAIAGWNGPGPFRIENNTLQAASENILFGGADPTVYGLTPSNITIRGNTITKSLAWKGKGFVVKNLIEFKNARNVLVEDNTFENSWTEGQTGTAILIKSANQDGKCPWCVSENITFRNNVIKNAEEGVRINAAEGNLLPPKASNIKFERDRFENITNRLFIIVGGVSNVTFDGIQASSGTGILFADTAPNPGLVLKNSYFINPLYGIGAGGEEGQPYLDKWFPGAIFTNNTILKSGELPARATQSVIQPAKQKIVPGIILTSASSTPSFLDIEVAKLMELITHILGTTGK